jgi:predicted dithiol-disulfide oxidoreductase (DUF899 family)
VTKEYVFDGPGGKATLHDLFDGCGQLIVYHFMFPPEWEEGCPHCSFWADNFDGAPVHLRARNASFAAVSRAPLAKLSAYKQRMGWSFPWFSSGETDFNYDFGVSFPADAVANGTAVNNFGSNPGFEDREGISIFAQDGSGQVFIPTPRMPVASTRSTGPTSFLISSPRAATNPPRETPNSGSAATTSTVADPAVALDRRRSGRG